MIGIGLFSRQQLAQPHLLGGLLASVVLHGVLLSQLSPAARPLAAPEPEPPVLVAHLWMPAPPLKPPPRVPTAPAERPTVAKSVAIPGARHAIVRQPVNAVAEPSVTATPADSRDQEPVALETAVPASTHVDRPLDLSPQAIGQAVRRSATPSLAQAAREQLGSEPASEAAKLGQHMAAGAVPDCLHNAPEGEAKSKPVAIGGLFALPFVAYAAMTGKCR